ncbi:MAG: universal stress protein [Saprospiraceae bacterium]|nr:universal stress protein [Saprospiraceae bacterium]
MKLLERILLASDFSDSSENVLGNAIEFGKIFQSEVIPIHILPDNVDKKVKTFLQEAATNKLNQTVEKIKNEGLAVRNPLLEFGSPSEIITQTAVAVNANLIIVGAGERENGVKFPLGTTTTRIIQKSEKPVFVVKKDKPLNVQHILCPVDFSDTSKQALKNAITIAHRFKAELTILAVSETEGPPWTSTEKAFGHFLEKLNLSGLSWHKEIRAGQAAEEILKIIPAKMIDLLVMGTVGRTGLSRLIMGSVTEKVVREVPCSFITMKSEDVIRLQLENDIRDIENHYNTGMQLMEDGFYLEAINQFKVCLNISSMHVPAYFGIAKVYEKMGKTDLSKVYRNSGKEIIDRLWYEKIEHEVRSLKGS